MRGKKKGREKGSGIGVSKTLSISLTPAQRDFLSRKLADTGATAAGYIRVLLDKDEGKRPEISVPESLYIAITPAQRDFLSRKLADTGAAGAGYIRVLLDREISKEQEASKEAKE